MAGEAPSPSPAPSVEASPIKGPEAASPSNGGGPEAQSATAKVADALQVQVDNAGDNAQSVEDILKNVATEGAPNDASSLFDKPAVSEPTADQKVTPQVFTEQLNNLDTADTSGPTETASPTMMTVEVPDEQSAPIVENTAVQPAVTPDMASTTPLSAADIRNDAADRYKAGKIDEAQFQTALDNAVPVALRNAGQTAESQAQPWTTEAPAATPDATEPPPLSEAKPEDVVTAAEQIKDEAAGPEDNADEIKSPEQEAAEMRLGRDKLVQKLLKENPNLDLSKPEVQAFLDLAGESPQNMDTLTKMTEQFMGQAAKETAEKMGIDPETFAKGSVDGIIKNIEDQLAALKKALGENATSSQKADMEKKGWFIKMLKALALVVGASLAVAGSVTSKAGEAVSAASK